MVGVGNEIACHKTVHKSKHTILDGADGIKMPAVTNSMLCCVNSMREIGAHDAEKKNKYQPKYKQQESHLTVWYLG